MATRAIKRKRDPGPGGPNWAPIPERAPSIIRADKAIVFRMIGMVGLVFTAVGTLAMIAPSFKMSYMIGPEWGFFWFTIGIGLLLFHAISDAEIQYRRTYGALGLVLLMLGIVFHVLPNKDGMGALFLPVGIPMLTLALGFLLAALRHETDAFWRSFALRMIGLTGGAMVLGGFLMGTANSNFLLGEGIVLLVLGLFYVSIFIAMQEPGSNIAYRAGLALGVIGALAFAVALFRSLRPALFDLPSSESYMVPDGLVLMSMGLLYVGMSLGICSDLPVVVMTRRELAAFFFSPIAYLVILGFAIVGWLTFAKWVNGVLLAGSPVMEPIVARYILDFTPVICLILIVPAITMRLLSEEKRSGTLEVLLTAPVNETSVVLSKYLAALIFFTVALTPWWLFLVSLRVFGGQPFDYRPLLSFFIALTCSGAGFIGLGVFFSSLTRNQIIAAVLTFAAIMGLTVVFWLGMDAAPPWREIFGHISYLDMWISALEGQFAPRYLLFHVSLAVFFVFLTIKVLEARKWT